MKGKSKNQMKNLHINFNQAASFTCEDIGKSVENTYTLWGELAGGQGIEDNYEHESSN